MNVKSSIRRTQSDINVFTKTFRDVQGLVGIKEKNEEYAKDDPSHLPSLENRNIVIPISKLIKRNILIGLGCFFRL